VDGTAAWNRFGKSVALLADGSRVASIGTPGIYGNGMNGGHVRIFDWTGRQREQLGTDRDGELIRLVSAFSFG
jgi:hypothetical protein